MAKVPTVTLRPAPSRAATRSCRLGQGEHSPESQAPVSFMPSYEIGSSISTRGLRRGVRRCASRNGCESGNPGWYCMESHLLLGPKHHRRASKERRVIKSANLDDDTAWSFR